MLRELYCWSKASLEAGLNVLKSAQAGVGWAPFEVIP